jgi:ferredoxin
MTYTISNQCIACENCLPYCPTGAIKQKENGKYAIDSNLCNDCADFYGVAQCMAGCPTFNGCTPTNWFATYDRLTSRLKAKKETKYWQHWFNTYSQKLDLLLHT